MNRKEFLDKYKGLEVKFVEYHKNKFLYEAEADNKKIRVWMGDKDNDIYRNYFQAIEKIIDFTLIEWEVKG